MAKSAESTRAGRLRRSRNVPSFLEESTESAATPPKTVNVVVDVHNEGTKSDHRRQRDSRDDLAIELASSRANKDLWTRSGSRENLAKDRRSKESRDHQAVDLIEELESPAKSNESPEEKPRRRKQWNVTNGKQDSEKGRTRRKRWSKDTSVIRLPETSDDPGNRPVPMPRSSVRRNALFFDNPAFASENDDEVLRIETDHNRESTKIEIRRMSDRACIKDVEETATASSGSWRKSERERAATTSEIKMSSSESKENIIGKLDSSTSLEKVTDVRSSSITSEERLPSRKERTPRREGTLRKRGRPVIKKEQPPDDNEISSSARDASSALEADGRARKKKKKKRKRKQKDEQRMVSETKEEAGEETKHISVTIHRADVLEDDYANVKRPMVKVHIVEARTGSYLANDTAERDGVLQPMITGKFDFKEHRSMIPVWEEELIFEYDFKAITRREDGHQVVILFEVVDLLSFAKASVSYDKIGSEGCWNKIAWAFLKPVGINDTLHTDRKVRLQLYRPRQSFKRYGKHKCEPHSWWQSNNRDKYPSSLFVTITSVPPRKVEPVIHQRSPLDDLLDDGRSVSRGPSARTSESIGLPKWARLAAQSCKIPNEMTFETEASENGCFYIAFSNDGKYLACVHSEEYNYPIIVYEVATGKIHVRFLGHKTFVYSLSWSSNDRHVLSASADQTACIWDVRSRIIQHYEMLPHPSYVYCAKYGPEKGTIVATGCYDRVARIWTSGKRSRKRELSQELEGHEGFVNSVVFQKSGNLITADSVGCIILWTVRKNGKMPSNREWSVSRKIRIREIEGVVINTIVLHPLESRLLVHSRDDGLRLVDLATGVVLQKYKQLANRRVQLKACISPCGGLVLCGGEDAMLNVWSLETGKLRARYTNSRQSTARVIVSCVDYHPYDHIFAFSRYGAPTSVRIFRFNKAASGDDIGLRLTGAHASRIPDNEVILNVFDRSLSRGTKCSRDMASRKELLPSQQPEHREYTVVDFGDDDYRAEQSWTKHHSREEEGHSREKSTNYLSGIIRKIDSVLSKTFMSSENYAKSVQRKAEHEMLRKMERGLCEGVQTSTKVPFKIFYESAHRSPSVQSRRSNNLGTARDASTEEGVVQKPENPRPMVREERPASAKEPETDKLANQDKFNKPLSDSAASSARFHCNCIRDPKRFDFVNLNQHPCHHDTRTPPANANSLEPFRNPSSSSLDTGDTYTLPWP